MNYINDDGKWVLVAKCSACKKETEYVMDETETQTMSKYICYGRQLGYIQNLFPKVPAWIRSGAIDQYNDGFCICSDCSGI